LTRFAPRLIQGAKVNFDARRAVPKFSHLPETGILKWLLQIFLRPAAVALTVTIVAFLKVLNRAKQLKWALFWV